MPEIDKGQLWQRILDAMAWAEEHGVTSGPNELLGKPMFVNYGNRDVEILELPYADT